MSIEVNGQIIEAKRITLLCHGDQPNDCKIKGRLPLDIEATIYHSERVERLHRRTVELTRVIFPNVDEATITDREQRNRAGMGLRHIIGLMDLSLKLLDQGTPFYWKYPEACLHPAACCNLADAALKITEEEEG